MWGGGGGAYSKTRAGAEVSVEGRQPRERPKLPARRRVKGARSASCRAWLQAAPLRNMNGQITCVINVQKTIPAAQGAKD